MWPKIIPSGLTDISILKWIKFKCYHSILEKAAFDIHSSYCMKEIKMSDPKKKADMDKRMLAHQYRFQIIS